MADLNLGGDESVQKKLPRIIVGGIRYEAVLTTRRIILAERENGTIREDIPYQDIVLAVAGQNSIREPQLRLTIASPAGEQRSIDLIFVYQPAGMNVQNIESCMEILNEHKVAVQKSGCHDAAGPMSRIQALTPGMAAGNRAQSRPAVPDMGLMSTFGSGGAPVPEDSQKTPWLIPIIVVAGILAVIFLGVFLAGQGPGEEMPVSATATPSPTATRTPVITPPVTTIIPVLPANTPPAPRTAVPTNGIWVRISYQGNYTGTLEAKGWGIDVNSCGTQYYLVPLHDTMIHSFIEKGDGSAGKLEVGIYNGGTLVSEGRTTRPYGIVELHVPVGPAAGGAVIPPSPTKVQVSPYSSLPFVNVPPSGVWVRVFSTRNYTGSIRANGQETLINSSGDQFYQIPIASGAIDGSVEKQDGSKNNLIIGIYKDGAVIIQSYTSAPFGVAEIHTRV